MNEWMDAKQPCWAESNQILQRADSIIRRHVITLRYVTLTRGSVARWPSCRYITVHTLLCWHFLPSLQQSLMLEHVLCLHEKFCCQIFTARRTVVQIAVLRSHGVRLSVCDVGGFWSHKLEVLETNWPTISPTPSLFVAQRPSTWGDFGETRDAVGKTLLKAWL